MNFKQMILVGCVLFCFNSQMAFCEKASPKISLPKQSATAPSSPTEETLPSKVSPATDEKPPSLDTVVDKIEKRYSGPGFVARFEQKSTLKAMEITDTASGKVFIKRPRLMRWEYELPEKQIIITDGNELWLYRPEDNQVMKGKTPEYFGDGKGASFLSDIGLVRKNFDVSFEREDDEFHVLKLVPKEKKYDIEFVHLWILKKTYDIVRIITYNSYGDENLIEMTEFQFKNVDGAIFNFLIPEGTDVLRFKE